MGQYVEQNLTRNERVVKSAELNPLKLVFAWVFGILFFWLFLIPLVKAIKATIIHVNTELAITNKRIIGKTGVANSGSLDAPLDKIQNVSAYTTFWGKLFNYGTIQINTAAGQFKFMGVKNVDSLKNMVTVAIDEAEEEKVKHQAEEMAAAMAAAMQANNPAAANPASTIVINNNQQQQ